MAWACVQIGIWASRGGTNGEFADWVQVLDGCRGLPRVAEKLPKAGHDRRRQMLPHVRMLLFAAGAATWVHAKGGLLRVWVLPVGVRAVQGIIHPAKAVWTAQSFRS